MTPAARVAAAIEILDAILAGQNVEGALTRWARNSRYAGSKDRAAVRDHVYGALRRKASSLAITNGTTGRDWMRGFLKNSAVDLASIFGQVGGHGPSALSDQEMLFQPDLDAATAHDIPQWLWPMWQADLGSDAQLIARALWDPADVFLRVNLAKSSREHALEVLHQDEIDAEPHPTIETAVHVTGRTGKIAQSRAYVQGLVELQDASSQASVMVLPRNGGGSVLDYCAGAGGKSLALAAWLNTQVDAFDVDAQRMSDLPARAARAGVGVRVLRELSDLNNSYKTVFCDAPCSGSGTWRRDPMGKWALTADRLGELVSIQHSILVDAASRVAAGGSLVYATCSVLSCENQNQVTLFCETHPDWGVIEMHQFVPTRHGDGFFVAHLSQKNG